MYDNDNGTDEMVEAPVWLVVGFQNILRHIERQIDQIRNHPSRDKRPLEVTRQAKLSSKHVVDSILPAVNSTGLGMIYYPTGMSMMACAADQYAKVSAAPFRNFVSDSVASCLPLTSVMC